MKMFLLGALTMWIILGIISLSSEKDRELSYWALWIIDFPLMVVVVPIWTILITFYFLFYGICKPCTQEHFNNTVKKENLKTKKILLNIYFCHDEKIKSPFRRNYFIRIKNKQ